MPDHDSELIKIISQLFIVSNETFFSIPEQMEAYKRNLGGVIFFNYRTDSMQTMLDQVSAVRSEVDNPFISVDEEGGSVSRISNLLGIGIPSPYSLKGKGKMAAHAHAFTIGVLLSRFGFNLNFAPVADICCGEGNACIGDRAYSNKVSEASSMVACAVHGFHAGRVRCTLKHWPGHGGAQGDSHQSKAIVDRTIEELYREDLRPFKAGIEAGADLVMTGHITVPSVDSLPASLSERWISCLRDVFGFKGVIITDSLKMKALSSYQEDELALMALKAGNDMALMPRDYLASVDVIMRAVESGELSMDLIRQKIERIRRVKSNEPHPFGGGLNLK